MIWTTEERRTIHKDRWIELSAERVITTQGDVLDPYYMLTYPDWSVALALTPDMQAVMIRQYRHGIKIVDLELPGGCVDVEDVSPLAAAERELLEETGFAAEQAEYVGCLAANPASQNNYLHVCLLHGAVRAAEPRRETGEEITVELMPLEKVAQAVLSGGMANAMHVAAVLLALNRLGRLAG